jgi:phosphoribosyl-ATP pyrophosphohydrolase
LSLTLRDGQHLCWKTFKKFETIDQKNSASFANADYLVKKSDEIAQKIKATENLDAIAKKEAIAKMLSELLFAAFVLAEQQGVNLEDSFLQTVDEMILGFVS